MRWDELLAIAGLIAENQVIFHSLDGPAVHDKYLMIAAELERLAE
jgi:hypothetical protein